MLKKLLFSLCLLFSFSSIYAQYQVNGNASQISENCFQITPAQLTQAGSVWALEQVSLNESFTLAFDIFLGCTDGNGADGIYFAMQPISTSLGSTGGGMGFAGIEPSIGVEFDTWQNGSLYNDPTFDHISIMQNGVLDHNSSNNLAGPIETSATSNNVEDCEFHNVRIQWNANSQTLEVYFDCALRVSYTGDIVNDIFGGDPMVFWGFTGGTGAAFNDQQVCFSYISFFDEVADQNICQGESVQLEASGNFQLYNWEPSEGLDNSSIANPIASPTQTTTYVVTLLDECGFDLADTITVFVENLPIDLGEDMTLCEGQTLTLDATTDNATYVWHDDSGEATYTVFEAGTYFVEINVNGCIGGDTIVVDYRTNSDAGQMPSDLLILCDGESTNLSSENVVLEGEDILLYVLHTSATDVLGDILATNTEGIFSIIDNTDILANTEYYVSAVAGNAADLLEIDALCNDITAGTPIVFLNPIGLEIDENCDWETGNFTVVGTATGGYPEYDATATYQIVGDFAGELFFGESFTSIFEESVASSYQYNVNDNFCAETIVSDDFYCEKTPIELLSFEGETVQNGNILKWQTATELNNDFFTLEYSRDGQNFELLTKIAAAGNSMTTQAYSFLDKNAKAGVSYYRLQQTDFDGTKKYVGTVVLNRETTIFAFQNIFPIPSSDLVAVSFETATAEMVEIVLHDISGRIVWQKDMMATAGNNAFDVDISGFSAGVYTLSVANESGFIVERIVKK